MKKLHLECNMGAAGDMLMGALYELLPDKEDFIRTMNNSGLEGTVTEALVASQCGINGTKMKITVSGVEETPDFHAHSHDHAHEHSHPHTHEMHCHEHTHPHSHEERCHEHTHDHEHHHHHHEHSSMASVTERIEKTSFPEEVKNNAKAIYEIIAAAESHAHGLPVSEVHFHEVGTKDALADILGVCYAIYRLAPDEITATPVKTGYGTVHCAHGIIPVPAPATIHILQGVPCYAGDIESELCTPTGAALIKFFAQRFCQLEPMTVTGTGYGMGTKVFPQANCVRAITGETEPSTERARITEIICNIDDMTPEAISYAASKLMKLGALDVATHAITMKKGRMGCCFTLLCSPEDTEKMAEAVLRETLSNGVRIRECEKRILKPSVREIETEYGRTRIKLAEGKGILHCKPEYDDAAGIAEKTGEPFCKVYSKIMKETDL